MGALGFSDRKKRVDFFQKSNREGFYQPRATFFTR